MAKAKILRAKLLGVERHGTSTMGNPTWRVIVEDEDNIVFTLLTKSNAAISYEISNAYFRGALCDFELTSRDRISYARIVRPGGQDETAHESD